MIIAASVILLGMANGEHSLFNSCKTLLSENADAKLHEATHCVGYIYGFQAGIMWHSVKNVNKTICFPEGFDAMQGARVFVRYVEDHPKLMHEHDALLAAGAFLDAFPCPPQE